MVVDEDVATNQRVLHPVQVDRRASTRSIVDDHVLLDDGARDDPVDDAGARAICRAVEIVVGIELDAGASVAPDAVAPQDRPIRAVRSIDAVLGAGSGALVVLDDEVVGERRKNAPAPVVVGAVLPERDVVRDLHVNASSAAMEGFSIWIELRGRHSDDLESFDGHVGRSPDIDPVGPFRPGETSHGGVERDVPRPRAWADHPRPGVGTEDDGTLGGPDLVLQIEPVVITPADAHRVPRLHHGRGALKRAPWPRRGSGSRIVAFGRDVVSGGPRRAGRDGGDESRHHRDRLDFSHRGSV